MGGATVEGFPSWSYESANFSEKSGDSGIFIGIEGYLPFLSCRASTTRRGLLFGDPVLYFLRWNKICPQWFPISFIWPDPVMQLGSYS